jgi:D-glycero-alpha-D-manno-heptose-7-phosphate kinase
VPLFNLTARAWCRVDLAGGTLDIWPLGLLHPGARTVNLAIDLAVTVTLRPGGDRFRVVQGESVVEAASAAALASSPAGALVGVVAETFELPPFEVRLASASPRGGGLGASSAMAVALLAAADAWQGRPPADSRHAAAVARDLEARLMALPTGVQDHYPALLGGALEILQLPGGEQVRRLAVDLEALGRSLLVVYSGVGHFSAGQNWQVVRRRLDGDPEVTGLFAGIAEVAAEMPAALESGDFAAAGELMAREWSYRRHLADGIETPELASLLGIARSLGAWGGKACGAGGGGCLALLCPPERRAAIADGVTSAGGTVLAAAPTGEPLKVKKSAS